MAHTDPSAIVQVKVFEASLKKRGNYRCEDLRIPCGACCPAQEQDCSCCSTWRAALLWFPLLALLPVGAISPPLLASILSLRWPRQTALAETGPSTASSLPQPSSAMAPSRFATPTTSKGF